jgi:hypothetical protein
LASEAVRISPTDHRAARAIYGAGALVALLIAPAALAGWLVISGAIYGISFAFAYRIRPARVSVRAGAAGELVIERRPRRVVIERSDIVNCWPWSRGLCTDLVIVTRRWWISIRLPDRVAARALGRVLVDTRQQLAGTTLSAAPIKGRAPRGFAQRHPWLLGLALGALFLTLHAESPRLFVVGVAGCILLRLIRGIASETNATTVLVGRDGVQLARRGRRRYIGYEQIERVGCHGDSVVLSLFDGARIRLPVAPVSAGKGRSRPADLGASWRSDPEKCRMRRKTLAAQIELALERFRSAGAAAAEAGRMLRRGSRSIAEWQRALARPGAYRERQIDREDALEMLENPQIGAEQRLGAALALAGLPDEDRYSDRTLRVRAAIASSANHRVRIALELALAGKLDDAAYKAALKPRAAPRHTPSFARANGEPT